MKRGTTRWCGWALAAVCLAGCSTNQDVEEKEKPKDRAVLVGRVASVPPGRGFVLIQSYGTWAVPPGAPVFSCGACQSGEGSGEQEGRLANLMPSGEKMGQFVAADIRSGQVETGDAVYWRPAKAEKKASDAAGPPNEGESGNPETPGRSGPDSAESPGKQEGTASGTPGEAGESGG
jgi:hypothetical protein